jgi:dynein intermediate chain 4, axonemal
LTNHKLFPDLKFRTKKKKKNQEIFPRNCHLTLLCESNSILSLSIDLNFLRPLASSAESENAMSRIRSSAMNAAAAQKLAEQVVVVELSETDTEIVLSLPSLVLSTELREAKDVEESNKAYEAIIEAHKNSDGFSSRPTQTLNNPQKNQNEMAAPNPSQEVGCQAVAYDILDAMVSDRGQQTEEYSLIATSESVEHDRDSGLSSHVAKFVADTVRMSLSTPGCLLDALDVSSSNPSQVIGNVSSKSGGGKTGKASEADVNKVSKSKVMNKIQEEQDISNGSGPRNSSNANNLSGAIGEAGDVFEGDDRVGMAMGFDYDSLKALEEANLESVLSSKTIMKKLEMIERAVQQNAYHRQILEYRDFPEVKPLSLLCDTEKVSVVDSVDHLFGGGLSALGRGATPSGGIASASIHDDVSSVGGAVPPNRKASHLVTPATIAEEGAEQSQVLEIAAQAKVKKLFTYAAPSLVRGRPVTCLSWNTENTDLLAVGYGKIDFVPNAAPSKGPNGEDLSEEEIGSGLVLFWSLRNPDYPEKVLRTPYAITSLDFSKRNPTLLAVGFYNGDVAVYDVRREQDWEKPMESSTGMSGSHSDPVWFVPRLLSSSSPLLGK